MGSDTKFVALRFLNEFGNEMKPDVLYEIAHPDFMMYDNSQQPRNLEEEVEVAREAYKVWSSMDYTVEDIVEEGERIAIRWKWKGRMLGEPAPEFSLNGIWFFELEDGLIKTLWSSWDESIFGDS